MIPASQPATTSPHAEDTKKNTLKKKAKEGKKKTKKTKDLKYIHKGSSDLKYLIEEKQQG